MMAGNKPRPNHALYLRVLRTEAAGIAFEGDAYIPPKKEPRKRAASQRVANR